MATGLVNVEVGFIDGEAGFEGWFVAWEYAVVAKVGLATVEANVFASPPPFLGLFEALLSELFPKKQ